MPTRYRKRTYRRYRKRTYKFGRLSAPFVRGMSTRTVRKVANQVHTYIRSHNVTNVSNIVANFPILWDASNQAPVYKAALGLLPNYSEFTNLYDFYMIKKVVLYFEPTFDGKDPNLPILGAAGSYVNPGLYSSIKYIRCVHDYDDPAALGSENEAFQYANMKSYKVGKPFRVVLYPRIIGAYYNTGGTMTAQVGSKPRWFSTQDYNVPHFGLKFWLNACTLASDFNEGGQIYNVTAKYTIMFKNSK